MDGIIWYEFEKEFEFDFTKIESSNLKILKIEKQNFESFSEQIKNSLRKDFLIIIPFFYYLNSIRL